MATRLKTIREGLLPKCSQEDMARLTNVTLATYRNAENGRNVSYSTAMDALRAINTALGERNLPPVTLEDLGLNIV